MKYAQQEIVLSQEQRRNLNDKVIYLIDSDSADASGITKEDIYNAYTGDGGLHGLNRSEYENYHAYSDAKKEIENGQFFTPPQICQLVIGSLRLGKSDLIADLTFGMGNFFNFLPTESNAYGCEIDPKAFKVAHYLYPEANLELEDIRTYRPEPRFDYVVGNPPFHLRWYTGNGEVLSQLYYCLKAAELLKPLGILALVVPCSFLSDTFSDKSMIQEMEQQFSFLGQVELPASAFSRMGVSSFPTKLQFWQKITEKDGWEPKAYSTEILFTLPALFSPVKEATRIYQSILAQPKEDLEKNKSHIILELARARDADANFVYTTMKLLYQIKVHPAVKDRYMKCCEYLHRFYTQKRPEGMDYKEWEKKRLTEAKVLAYLRSTLKRQNKKPALDVVRLVKQDDQFVYKAYSAKASRQMSPDQKEPIPINQVVLDNTPERFPAFARFLRRRRREYETQNQPFQDMKEDPVIATWLQEFTLWDSENEEVIQLNDLQRHDINLILQKRYGLLQWEQGSGKTLAAIATGMYRMEQQHLHSTWVISSAISIRNNWDVALKNYGLPYVFVERLADLEHIRSGDFVIMTLNKMGEYRKHIKRWLKMRGRKIQFVLDESDEISNPSTVRAKAALDCFRRCRSKLLTTGTSTRNNISEFAPQLELLYNNSINMLCWCDTTYTYDREDGCIEPHYDNPYYGKPIPPYKTGYALFSSCHLPEKTTVFGIGERTQDIYNADVLDDILAKTVITRTFEEITGKDIRRIQQVPVNFALEERAVYQQVMKEFEKIWRNYFASTGNARKDAGLKLMQQITLLLRVSAAPNTLSEYEGGTPVKIMKAVKMAAQWDDQIVAIGVRHKNVLDAYVEAFQEYLPDRPLFVVTGSTTSFAKRRALRRTLRESGNGVLLCTQQSLPSSVNFEYINKIIIPELHFNNSGMSQFYMRFIRYTSTEFKDIYFLTYAGSLESNLMQMVVAKEKINLFMKGKDADLDEIYERFGIDYNLMALLMRRELDKEGHFQIRWGEQMIA
jgi:SAM-dependent methyltransferase